MGAWGVKIYQDDVACDVRDEYKEALKKGISNEEITAKLKEDYCGDIDDEPIFWFALADTQWKYGRLLKEVKENALKFIESGEDLERWEEEPKQYEKRKQVLLELKEELNTPQPEEKKVKGYGKMYKCEWKIGDVFSYPLESEEAKEIGLEGQYIILIKTGETRWYPEHIIPIVRLKITKDGRIPETVEEINELEYIQTGFYTYYYDPNVILEIFQLPKDEYGLTPYYNAEIITTSTRMIPKKLKYVGNFYNDLVSPKPDLPHEIKYKNFFTINFCQTLYWEKLEQKIIELYRFHKLKQLAIYQPDYWEKRGIDREAMDKRIEAFFKSKGKL